MNPYLHDALYQFGLYWCVTGTAACVIYLLLYEIDKLRNRFLMHADRRKSRKHGFVMVADNIPGTSGYRIRTRMVGYNVHH